MEILDVVDENENIIGQETREKIHRKGLLHREIHVWLYTTDKKVIFQLRAKDKDTFPNLLDASVGGHVDQGDSYLEAAQRELEEETGILVDQSDLKEITKMHKVSHDSITGMTNNAILTVYAFTYDGDISKLKIEDGAGQGFEAWPIKNLIDGLNEEDAKRFIPTLLTEEYKQIYKQILDLD